MPLHAHVGCGSIYLRGWKNLDAQGVHVSEATSDQLRANTTTLAKYFKYPYKNGSPVSVRKRPVIVDCFMQAMEPWPFFPRTVSQLLTVSFIEHFSPKEHVHILNEVEKCLVPGGEWLVDFPDIVGSVRKYAKTNPEYLARLIFCHQEDIFSQHKWGWTFESFCAMLLKRGTWKSVKRHTFIKHAYPTIGVVATKR